MAQQNEPGLDNLLDRLRRQSTMSPLQQTSMLGGHHQQQQQQHQQHQQHQQQAHQPMPQQHQPFAHQPDNYAPPQPLPFPPNYQTDSPVYHTMNMPPPPYPPMPGFAHPPPDAANAYPPAYGQPPHPEPAQQHVGQSPLPTPGGQHQQFPQPVPPSLDGNNTDDRTASLLQLLKFSKAVPETSGPAPSHSPTPPHQGQQTSATVPPPRPYINSPPPAGAPGAVSPHNRAISAQDLVASIMSRPSADGSKENAAPSASTRASPVQQRTAPESIPERQKSPVNPQDLVFQLLGRPKPATGEPQHSQTPPPNYPENKDKQQFLPANPVRSASSSSLPPLRSNQNSQEGPGNKGMFSYVNPFEQLSATSPRNRTPKPGATNRKSTLGLNELKAENIPLPYTPPAQQSAPASPPAPVDAPPAPIEAEASKEAATIEQVQTQERMLLEQLESQAQEYPGSQQSNVHPEIYDQYPEQQEQPLEASQDQSVEFSDIADPEPIPEAPQQIREVEVREPAPQPTEEVYDEVPAGDLIEVYNFPMKPFVSITLIPDAIRRPRYPESKFSDIARMARTFDQLDRNLISASREFIAYAMSKSGNRGGIRIIRQYDGQDRILMKDTQDRTFNVTITRGERVLGTSVSGAVVWVDLIEDFDKFDRQSWDSMFIFPPSEEQGQSNGVLKSRARKTSRNSNIFAIGRGRTINVIYAPAAKAYAQGGKGNEVDSRKYLAEHGRIIDTGKASKDFAFSDDDSVIISIDKAGKLKFWDVQDLLDFNTDAYDLVQKSFPPQPPRVLSTPTLVFSAVAAGESYRATSVMFLDKYRPYLKCLALRYVLVGMKQNHTLQLWDLALGRPVQEINFPQESDTDALCSVVYHPSSGIIVVGNPTRNSIYFIHLSAPKYNLPALSQAQYIEGLANRDPTIPKPEATAILSGLREYSFAAKGQLMSVDLLDTQEEQVDEGEPALFELYVAHSKGMTTLRVHKEDLGWFAENKVKNPVNAVEKGACTIASLPSPPSPQQIEREEKHEAAAESSNSLKPKEKRGKSRSVSPAAKAEKSDIGDDRSAASTSSKKKKKDRSTPAPTSAPAEKPAEEKPKAKAADETASRLPANVDLTQEVQRIEKSVTETFKKVLGSEMEQLYRKVDEDRRVQQAAGEAKQDAILRLLSSTLTDNVQHVIASIVQDNIQERVVPHIANVTAKSVDKTLGDVLSRNLSATLPNELRQIIPDAVNRAVSHPDIINNISNQLIRPITQAVEHQFSHVLQTSVVPQFHRMALDAAQKTVLDVERKQNETIARLEQMHREDSLKIDNLTNQLSILAQTVTAMAKSQAEFQDSVRQAQEEFVATSSGTPSQSLPDTSRHHHHHQPPPPPQPQKTAAQIEAEEIELLLQSQRYEDGTIKWLQSKERQAELFDEVMVRYRYDFLPNLSQLVLLSVSAAVSVKFENKVMERLSWLEGVLAVLDPHDPEISEICQRIMGVVVQRLEQLYMSVSVADHGNPVLRKIPAIARKAKELSQAAGGGA